MKLRTKFSPLSCYFLSYMQNILLKMLFSQNIHLFSSFSVISIRFPSKQTRGVVHICCIIELTTSNRGQKDKIFCDEYILHILSQFIRHRIHYLTLIINHVACNKIILQCSFKQQERSPIQKYFIYFVLVHTSQNTLFDTYY